MIAASAYTVQLEQLLAECRAVMMTATEHGKDWPMLGMSIVLDKIDRLDIDHDNNPNRCRATVDIFTKIMS